jgi:hypothetical protein
MALVIGVLAIAIAIGWQFLRSPNVIHEDCSVDLLNKEISPDGTLAAEYKRGTCDGGTIVIHTLGIAPVQHKPNEKAPSVVLQKTAGGDAAADLNVKLRWLNPKTIEVTHPGYVQPLNPAVLNGVTVVGTDK